MFELGEPDAADPFRALVAALATLEPAGDDRSRIEQLAVMERAKCALSAAQARITASLAAEHQGSRSVGAQVGLARRESPHRGRRLTGLAVALVRDLPETLAALTRGDINEHRAQLVADGTRDLCAGGRRAVDTALAERLPGLGDREVQLAVAREAMRTDPDGTTARREAAQGRRRISGRWLGDGTGQITAIVPDAQYAAIMTSLREAADTDKAAGDSRSHAQLLVDHFVARLTGQVGAQRVPVSIGLVLSAETLLAGDDEPGEVTGYGPVPASVARALAVASPEHATRIRRLFRIDPTEHLIAMESRSRLFDGLLREFITLRDRLCRTPWCGGPIRAADHATRAADGGPTTALNGQGLCEDCNLTKEQPGWRHDVRSRPLEPHLVEVASPTGHTYHSRAPSLPRGRPDWTETRPGVWQLAA